jgi:hypothetical protein
MSPSAFAAGPSDVPARATATVDRTRPQVVCLTPVKNEAWILERFLHCASFWADRIIVADQGSDDGSSAIAQRFPKVELIQNTARHFNELERQQLLIQAARRLPGPKLLVALDADEVLTANVLTSSEWEMALRAIPGTVINFQLPNILPDRRSYYVYPTEFSFAFMDDGTEHDGPLIHSPRVPRPQERPRLSLREIKVLHLATMDERRFRSRIRWYQCWELLHGRDVRNGRWDGSLARLYRNYHRDFFVADHLVRPLPAEWIHGYGIDLLDVADRDFHRWDAEILTMFATHGTRAFRKLAIWDVDWGAMHERVHGRPSPVSLADPRSWLDRWIQRWLERTQPAYSHGAAPLPWTARLRHRLLERSLALAGW